MFGNIHLKRSFKSASLIAALSMVVAACAPAAPAAPAAAPAAPAAEATKVPEPTAAPAAAEATKAPEATTAPEPTKAAEPAAGEMKKYKGSIVISTNGAGNPEDGRFKGLIEAYNKLQPDVKVTWEGPPQGTGYDTWLGTQLAAGNVNADIVSGNYQPTYGKYINLDKYRFQTNPYTGNKWTDDVDWDFYVERDAKGSRRMIATEAVHIMWFYNKDLFKKASVKVPTTWDELADACDGLLKAGITPIATNYVWKLPQWVIQIYLNQYNPEWVELVRSQPGDYNYDEELDGKFVYDVKDRFSEGKFNVNPARRMSAIKEGKMKFDSPEMVELVMNMKKVFPRCASKSLFVDTTDYSEFLQGEVAMIIDGTWSLPGLGRDMENLNKLDEKRLKDLKITDASKLKPFEWATFENPPMISGLVKQDVRSVESASGSYASVIDKNAEQTELVIDFLMFWYSQPGYQAWVDGGVNSPLGYSPSGPIQVKGVQLPAKLQEVVGGIKMMGNAENGRYYPWDFGGVDDLSKQGQDLYKQALEGKITPEAFTKALQKLWDDNWDTILKKAGLTEENLKNPARQPGS